MGRAANHDMLRLRKQAQQFRFDRLPQGGLCSPESNSVGVLIMRTASRSIGGSTGLL
jgi:hypothetical protein